MKFRQATATACSNIALIKYWGNRDDKLRLPVNGSISMNLDGVNTTTTVTFKPGGTKDVLYLNGVQATDKVTRRVSEHLDHIRELGGIDTYATVVSENNFPMGAGIASSASAFAALTVAACAAARLNMTTRAMTSIARLGSGSASRSIPGGYVEWYAGNDHETSYAESIASTQHWDLVDLVAIISDEHKDVGSTGGHSLASTSPLQAARIADSSRRLAACRDALMQRDMEALAEVVEHDALMMHAIMMTSNPPLLYWEPPTLDIIKQVQKWRSIGIPVCFTIDAGANVHVLTTKNYANRVKHDLDVVPDVKEIIAAGPGRKARLLESHLKTPASLPHN